MSLQARADPTMSGRITASKKLGHRLIEEALDLETQRHAAWRNCVHVRTAAHHRPLDPARRAMTSWNRRGKRRNVGNCCQMA